MGGNNSYTITVEVQDDSGDYDVTLSPNQLEVDQDGTATITWQASTSGLPFTFDATNPITFSGSHTPLTTPAYDAANNTVTCTDTVTADGLFPYSVTLLVSGDPDPITYPEAFHVGNGDPTIHNKPE
jgi:hypothetical protein